MKRTTLRGGIPLIAALLFFLLPLSLPAEDGFADLDSLDALFEEARDTGRYDEAMDIAKRQLEVTFPRHVTALYNIAAMHGRLGDTEKAYKWLQYAFDAGYWDHRGAREDESFAAIREEPRFRTMTYQAWVRAYIDMLERDEREDFQKPLEVMEALALEPGERVADVGAGSGYFTIPVAEAVGPEGSVLATDIRQEMLDHIDGRLERYDIENVKLQLVPADDPQLPEGSLDTILMVDVWHYIRDPNYAKKLRDGLAPGGRVVVIDYRPKAWEDRPWGPPPEQQKPREELDAHMAEAGLGPVRTHDFLPEQYFVEYESN